MRVIDPNNTTHTINVIPRFYNFGVLSIDIYNENKGELVNVPCVSSVTNGILTLQFDLNTSDDQRYSIKVKDPIEVVYRGKMIATNQDSQDYKQSTNKYIYV